MKYEKMLCYDLNLVLEKENPNCKTLQQNSFIAIYFISMQQEASPRKFSRVVLFPQSTWKTDF